MTTAILVSKGKIQAIHAVLAKMGKVNDKEFKLHLVKLYSGERATSTKDMYEVEAAELLKDLNAALKKNKTPEDIAKGNKIRLMYYYAHCMEWYEHESDTSPHSPSKGNSLAASGVLGCLAGTVETGDMSVTAVGSMKSRKVDRQRLDDWAVKYGQFHKKIVAHSSAELSKVLVQMEAVYHSYLSGV